MIINDIKKLPVYNLFSSDDKHYCELDLKSLGYTFERLSDAVVVVYEEREYWVEYVFLAWSASILDNTSKTQKSYYHIWWHGEGASGLREARHSYIGDGGYIFYIKRDRFNTAFNFLSKYFDLD